VSGSYLGMSGSQEEEEPLFWGGTGAFALGGGSVGAERGVVLVGGTGG